MTGSTDTLETAHPETIRPAEKPNKKAKGRKSSGSVPSRPEENTSPEKARVSNRRSSHSVSRRTSASFNDDPFDSRYQSSPRPLSRSSNNLQTVVPLAHSDSEEEGEIRDFFTAHSQTPRPRPPQPRPETPTHASTPPPPPPQFNADQTLPPPEDVSMEDPETRPFAFPTEDEFKALPVLHRDQCPHKNAPAVADEGPSDLLNASLFQINTGEFPAPVIPFHIATAGLSAATCAALAKDPSRYVLLVMFLGGHYFFKQYKSVATDIQKVLSGVAPKGITLSVPAPDSLVEDRDKYKGPIAVVARCTNAEIRDAVVRHSTYPSSTSLAFHALPVNLLLMSWVIGHFNCNVAGDDAEIADAFRWLVAEALMVGEDASLRQLVVRATQPGATETASNVRVYNVARTVFAVHVAHEKNPFWVLYMKPCSPGDQQMWGTVQSAVRNRVYSDGFHTFTPLGYKPGKIVPHPSCHMCKLDCHLAYVCKFSKAYWAWSGPPDVITAETTGVLAIPTRPTQPPRPRGGFQGKASNNRAAVRGG
ncbi:hypothetical protein C8R47DRAFT_189192 [Mycena vitilis]|nr:hypothetical protein C8R47DRAFT_189192 [Mycena vitilis]